MKHMLDFARDVQLTHDEWRTGIEFWKVCAAIECADRLEFVLASDVLGLSSLVDMLHLRSDATSSSVLGPFHVSNAPPLAIGGDMKRHYAGPVLLVEGQVTGTDGKIIPYAECDIWQS